MNDARANVFARLLAQVNSVEEAQNILYPREMGINSNSGTLIYRTLNGETIELDTTSLETDIRNIPVKTIEIIPNQQNIIGIGKVNGEDFDRSMFVKPTVLHSINIKNNINYSDSYMLILRNSMNEIINTVSILPLHSLDPEYADELKLGEGIYEKRVNTEHVVSRSRITGTNVAFIELTSSPHELPIKTYPTFNVLPSGTSVVSADNVANIGSLYQDPNNRFIYMIAALTTPIDAVIAPTVIDSAYSYTKNIRIQPFIPFVDMGYSIEIAKVYYIDQTTSATGELEFPSYVTALSILEKETDISDLSGENPVIDNVDKKIKGLIPEVTYRITLKIEGVADQSPKCVYSYVEFTDNTLPNLMRAINYMSDEFQQLRPTIIKVVEEYTKKYWEGFSPGYADASFNRILHAETFKIETPLQEYDPSQDILLLFLDGKILINNLDYSITHETSKIFINKMTNGVIDTSNGWVSGSVIKATVLIKTGVTDKNIIYKTYESSFEVKEPNTIKVPINISHYNADDEDILFVSQDNSMLFKNINYELKNGSVIHDSIEYVGPYIELLGHNVKIGTWFFFCVIKASRSIDPVGTIDPRRIRKGLTPDQFAGDFYKNIVTKDSILSRSLVTKPVNDKCMIPMIDTFRTDITKTGHLIIHLPFGWCNTFVDFKLTIRPSISTSQLYSIDLGGYLSTEDYIWKNCYARLIGTNNTTKIILAYNNGKACIVIGNSATEWDKPFVKLESFVAEGIKTDGWNFGWNFGLYNYQEMVDLGITRTQIVEPTIILP